MKRVNRLLTFLLLALLSTTLAWGGNIATTSVTGGTIAYYSNETCTTGLDIDNVAAGSTVYVKATPDAAHSFGIADADGKVTFITAQVTTSVFQSRRAGGTAPLGSFLDVWRVSDGIYRLTMPDDANLNVRVSAVFPNEELTTYLDANGQEQEVMARILTGTETEPLTTGWYVADGTINFTNTILVNGDIHIILKDNAVMNVGTEDSPVQTGIEGIIQHLSNINIYGQSTGENNGQLNIYATYVDIRASGGDFNCSSARVTTSLATGTSIYATSSSGTGGNITLKDATVNVSGSIGLQANGNLTINGGEVNATTTANYGIGIYAQGGSVTINGGEVHATATASNGYGIQAQNGSVTINGGQVTASGTQYGIYAYNGNITLGWTHANDYVHANGYYAQGTLSIADGKTFIDEDGNTYSGIYSMDEENRTYPINGKKLRPNIAVLKGDANGDGVVNVTDIMAVANYILNIGMTVFDATAADVNGDNVVNVTDVMGIANIILNVTPSSNSRANSEVEDTPEPQ